MAEQIRLNKYLAQCGICSRRDADKLIEQGRVTVNGTVALMGTQVTGEEEIYVNKKILQGKEKNVVLAYYKPVGVVCTERDEHAAKKLTDMIKYPVRVTYAGRLDKDSEGLLLLTNDGTLIQTMMKGANRHEKEYIVKVKKQITDEFLEKMSGGIYLKELDAKTRPCRIDKIGPYTFRIILTQGLNRQIRRMCEACKNEVVSLKRVRVMTVPLGDLKVGTYRELTKEECMKLYTACGLKYPV